MAKPSASAIAKIAHVMHESVRAWQMANGEKSSPSWGRAPNWMKDASIASVVWRLENPHADAAGQHEQWMAKKRSDGWKHGRIKSGVKKTHPMMVAYADLPDVEKRKDALVNAVIDALLGPAR
jgi:hypothetical protein